MYESFNLAVIGSENGSSPLRLQAIIRACVGKLLLIDPFEKKS